MKKMHHKIIVTLVVLLMHSLVNRSDASVIYASGNLTFNTLWAVDTVIINGDLNISSGVTLTINPATKVIFNGHYKINVYGTILAIGNQNNPIIFTINDTTGFSNINSNAGGWYGIRYTNNLSSDTSKFIYCRFYYGKANGTNDDANGGAIFVKNFSKILIENCIFEKNIAKTNGGAIYLRKSNIIVRNNSFYKNKSSSGGGIYISSGEAYIYNNVFNLNFASSGGGGVFCADTTTSRIHGNLLFDNMGLLGGGIGCYSSNPNLHNNTIYRNKATHGGALSCINSSPTLKNCILYSNTGSGTGNQVSLLNPGCNPNFYYCNIQGGQAAFGGSGVSSYSGIYQNNISLPPQFEDTVTNNYLIKQTSPCRDAGTPDTSGLKLLPYDIAKNPRINMGVIDIGAYERQQIVSFCGTITENTTWSADTVKINCNITINNGVTLTINPKVYVELQGQYAFYVNGRIVAVGTPADSIIFTSKNQNTGWLGFIFNNTSSTNDSSIFKYCRITYCKNNTGNGSALFINNFSKIYISNALFRNNSANNGGAIYAKNSNAKIKNSKFINNSANFTIGKGGAIYADTSSNLSIDRCIFAYNSAYMGGSIHSVLNLTKIYSSFLSNNICSYGGAISCDSADIKIINSIITNNTATVKGGGAYLFRSKPAFTNTNIVYNATSKGGAYYIEKSSPITNNSILFYNTASSSGNQVFIHDTTSAPQFKYSDVSGDTTAFGYSTTQKFKGIYTNNKDTIPAFMQPPAGAGAGFSSLTANYALDGCSNLYNKGNPDTTGLKLPNKDYAFNQRIYANRIDIGAYEIIKPHILAQPQSVTVCEGDTAIFTVSVNSSYPVNYQWQYSLYGTIWLPAPGATNDSVYIIPNVSGTQNGYYYRCVISAACTQNVNSQNAILHVNTPPAITSQPNNLTICQNETASFSVGASGTGTTYQWQQQAPGSTTWSNCSGSTATQATYTINNTPITLNGYKYRCIVSGACEPEVISTVVLLTVKAIPSISSQPSNQSGCQGDNVTFTIVGSGTNITFLWEESTDGGSSWHTAPGNATSSSYSINGITAPMNGYRYRCTISGDCQPAVTSTVVTLTVYTNPQITQQPQNTHVCVNNNATISVTATGGNLTYQWEKKSPGETVWSNASGPSAVTANYQINNASTTLNGTWYRCKIQNTCPPSIISDSVQLFVHPNPTVNLGPDATIFLYGDPIVIDAGSGYSSYLWSTGAQTQTITIYGISEGVGPHLYTVTVTNSYGCQATDDIIITVLDNTNTEDITTHNEINIYPNPTYGILNISYNDEFKNSDIWITTPLGQIIYNNKLSSFDRKHLINLSELSKGVYFIIIKTENSLYKKKIVLY